MGVRKGSAESVMSGRTQNQVIIGNRKSVSPNKMKAFKSFMFGNSTNQVTKG